MRHHLPRLGLAMAVVLSLLTAQTGHAVAAAPASAPTILSPADGSSVGNANPTLSWSAVPGAFRYRVQISATSSFSTTIYSADVFALQATDPNLLPFSTLYWRVAGEDEGSVVGPWSVASFTKTISSAPVTVTPTNNQTLTFPTDAVVFSWQPVPGATSYTIQVGNSADFIGAQQFQTYNTSYTLTDTQSFTLSDGTTPQSWWWQVQAKYVDNSVTQWSTAWNYQITWPAVPQLESPADGATGVVDTVFSWDPVPGAAWYEIQVSPNGDWQNNTIDQPNVNGTRFAPDQTLNNSSYYWRVRARAAGNATNYGQWSDPFVFSRSWSSRPLTQNPHWTGGLADPPIVTNLEFSWTPAASSGAGWVDHASRYQIEIGTDVYFSNGTYSTCYTNQTTFTPYSDCLPSLSVGTPYYWRVRGIDDPGVISGLWDSTSSSDTQRFIWEPPLPSLSCGPADGAHVQTPVLCWSAVAGAQTYQVTILRHDGVQAAQDTTWALSYTPTVALNPTDGPFTWNVVAIDAQGHAGLIRANWPSFYLDAPTTNTSLALLTPANLTSTVRMPSMTWMPYTGASYYEVLYGVTPGTFYVTPLSGGSHLPFAGFTYEQLPLSAQKYYWVVQAYDAENELLATSPMGSFFVGAPSAGGDWIIPWASYLTPECQSRTSARSCTPSVGQTQELSWTAEPNAGAYVVYVAKDANFTNVYKTYETGLTSLTPLESWLDSQAGDSYYWFVRPCVDWSQQHCGPGPDSSAGLDNASAYRKSSPPTNGLTTTTAANPPVQASTIADQVTFNWADYMTTSQAATFPITGVVSSRVTQEAKRYTIQVSTTSDFSALIDTRTVDQVQYTPWSLTYPEGPLYWRVQASDGSDNPLTMSSTATVTKASAPITLTSPANSATVSGLPYFTWAPQNWAARYTIEVYRNGDLNFSNVNLQVSQTTPIAAWSPTANMAAGVYAWRVRRLDMNDHPGPWSAGRTFTLHPAAPALNTPADLAQLNGSNLYFTWSGIQGAVSYQFQSSAAADFNALVENQTTVMTAWSPTGQYNPGVYFWRVNVLDAANNVLATSSARSFSANMVPGAPTDVTATGGNSMAAVSWTAPASNGGAAITTYTVTSSPDGRTCTTSGALSCSVSGLSNGSSYTFTVTATNSMGTGPASNPSASLLILAGASQVAGATYVPLTPARILDSRDGTGGLSGPFSTHVARTFQVVGRGGVPGNATAITGNLTVTAQTAPGYLSIGPIAMNNPTSSTLNFPLADDRANAVTVALGVAGTLSITYASVTPGSTAQVILDVTGYFVPDRSGATYHALTPTRLLDSRDGTGGLWGAFSSHVARTFAVTGHGGVPANATAVTGNLTVTNQTALGFLYLGPNATNDPTSSTLNFPVGDDRANAVTVALGGGTLSATYASTPGSTAQVIFDVTGYFTPDMSGATYVALNPARILDSRDGTGGMWTALSSHVARTFPVAGQGGVPTDASAVTGNLTVTQQTNLGFLYIGPNATNNPTSSTLNFPVGDDRANAATVALGGSSLSVTYAAGTPGASAQVIFDVTGYFKPAS